MEVSARPAAKRSGRRYSLLQRVDLQQQMPLRLVSDGSQTDNNHSLNLTGTIIEGKAAGGLALQWTAWEPFGLKNAAYTVSVQLSFADLGAIVTAATRDPLLGELVRKKASQQPPQYWLVHWDESEVGKF